MSVVTDDGCEKCDEKDDNLYNCCRCDARLCETCMVFPQDFGVEFSGHLCGRCALAWISDRKAAEQRNSKAMKSLQKAERHCYSLID
jgi:hypothetical protein